MTPPCPLPTRPLRVLHVVTGGFSGATSVAVTLVRAAAQSPHQQAFLALRRKRQTEPARVQALRAEGLAVHLVPGWSHAATVWSLVQLCRRLRPDLLVAHGFSEHLWARYAGLLAQVPVLVHVEHNSRERYTRWRLAQTRWLARRTAAIVGCSEGVRQSLLLLGMPPERTLAISNGIDVAPFDAAASQDDAGFARRVAGLVMVARFSRQKDHATLLQALALLALRGLRPPVQLVGMGGLRHLRPAQNLVQRLGLAAQVHFVGHTDQVPELLMGHQVCVLSTHYEGMPLALVEGMAAGCAVIGSSVPGVSELLDDGRTGLLVPEGDAGALAHAIERLLHQPGQAAAMGRAARVEVLARYTRAHMTAAYEALCLRLANAAGLGR